MAVRPKLSNATVSISQRRRRRDPRQIEFQLEPHELYREECEDDDGNRYTVIVWRPFPGLSLTDYTLDDGTPVKFVDNRHFEIGTTGTLISRCV
jgi:hypothetical protein